MGIGGNTIAELQVNTGSAKNEIGERITQWSTADHITGWLDLSGGDAKYNSYNAKIQESTHVFIADWKEVDVSVTAENSRMLIHNRVYDVMLIDNPMELNQQLEIYLKYTGGQ